MSAMPKAYSSRLESFGGNALRLSRMYCTRVPPQNPASTNPASRKTNEIIGLRVGYVVA